MAYSLRLESLRDLVELYGREIAVLDRRIAVAGRQPRPRTQAVRRLEAG